MGLIVNGVKQAKPFINGVSHNCYINGQKIWNFFPYDKEKTVIVYRLMTYDNDNTDQIINFLGQQVHINECDLNSTSEFQLRNLKGDMVEIWSCDKTTNMNTTFVEFPTTIQNPENVFPVLSDDFLSMTGWAKNSLITCSPYNGGTIGWRFKITDQIWNANKDLIFDDYLVKNLNLGSHNIWIYTSGTGAYMDANSLGAMERIRFIRATAPPSVLYFDFETINLNTSGTPEFGFSPLILTWT